MDGLAFLGGLALVNVVFFPILVAILVSIRERGASQDLFWATRPVGDNTLLLVRLKVAIASLLASWGLWLTGAIVIGGLLWLTDKPEGLMTDVRNFTCSGPFGFIPRQPLLITVPILGIWTVLGIVGSLHATGRKWAAALWILPLPAPTAWAILVGRRLIAPDVADLIRSAGPWIMGILCLAGTGLAYWAALRKGRISRRLGLTVLGAYLAACYATYPYPDVAMLCLVGIYWAAFRKGRVRRWLGLTLLAVCTAAGYASADGWGQFYIHEDLGAVVHRVGLMALPLVPLALGPLAIAWNRHR